MDIKQTMALITGSRNGFLARYLECVERGEKLDVAAIKERWWNGVLFASSVIAFPFLFLLDFESIALNAVFVVVFLWCIWFLMNRVFDGYRSRDFEKHADPWSRDRLRYWEKKFPALSAFYKANGIYTKGASDFEHDLVQQWVARQHRPAASTPAVNGGGGAGDRAVPPPSGPVAMEGPVLVTLRSAEAMVNGVRVASYRFCALGVLVGVIVGAMIIMALIPELGSFREGLTPAHWVVIVAGAMALTLGLMPQNPLSSCLVVTEDELRQMLAIGIPSEVVDRTKRTVLLVKDLE